MKDFFIRSDAFLFRAIDEIPEQANPHQLSEPTPPNEENYPQTTKWAPE
jgi:hypothetical protein